MILALGFAAAGFVLGVAMTALGTFYVFALVRQDMLRQLEGYGAASLFTFGGAARRDKDFDQGRMP